MNEQPSRTQTDFDRLTSDSRLQMIKAAMPYLGGPSQRLFSILVKCQELRKTMELFDNEDAAAMGICSLDDTAPHSPYDMLMVIKPYGSRQEQELIDTICNVIQGIRLGNQYQEMQPRMDPASLLMQTIKQMA